MTPTRHEQLISAGWRYDPAQDRYAAPGSPTDGTEKWRNLNAAWQAHETTLAQTLDAAPTPAKGTRAPDPRRQEPQ